METKQQLRDEAGRRINDLSPEQRIVLDAHIATHVTHMPFWSTAGTVFGYMALNDEVDLQAVFRAAVRAGKTIALPRVTGRDMDFRVVDDYPTTLERHPFGFLQPSADAPAVQPVAGDLILVPGRMFDRRGYRVGRGGGYYDRFLGPLPESVVTVGVGYAVQLLAGVPNGSDDAAVQIVVTDSESCFAGVRIPLLNTC